MGPYFHTLTSLRRGERIRQAQAVRSATIGLSVVDNKGVSGAGFVIVRCYIEFLELHGPPIEISSHFEKIVVDRAGIHLYNVIGQDCNSSTTVYSGLWESFDLSIAYTAQRCSLDCRRICPFVRHL